MELNTARGTSLSLQDAASLPWAGPMVVKGVLETSRCRLVNRVYRIVSTTARLGIAKHEREDDTFLGTEPADEHALVATWKILLRVR